MVEDIVGLMQMLILRRNPVDPIKINKKKFFLDAYGESTEYKAERILKSSQRKKTHYLQMNY